MNVVQNFEKYNSANNNMTTCTPNDVALLQKWVEEEILGDAERKDLDSLEEPTPCSELIGSF